MKLFERVQTYRLLTPNAAQYVAITANDHGACIAFGDSNTAALNALEAQIQALRTPPDTFTEPFGPRTRAEWIHEQGDWYK